MARYEKAGRVGVTFHRLKKPLQKWFLACEAKLEEFMMKPALAGPAPLC